MPPRDLPTAAGLALGAAADLLLADPRRWHPVAGFGRAAAALERLLWRDSRAAGIDAVHPGPEGAGQLGVGAGHRQAALLGDLLGRFPLVRLQDGQLRVHHVADDVLAVGVRAVHHEHPGVDADLVGRQPHPVGGVHAREHVQHEAAQGLLEHGHRGARPVQDRIAAVGHDRPDFAVVTAGQAHDRRS